MHEYAIDFTPTPAMGDHGRAYADACAGTEAPAGKAAGWIRLFDTMVGECLTAAWLGSLHVERSAPRGLSACIHRLLAQMDLEPAYLPDDPELAEALRAQARASLKREVEAVTVGRPGNAKICRAPMSLVDALVSYRNAMLAKTRELEGQL